MKHKRIAQKRRFFGFVLAVVLVAGLACGCAAAKSTGEATTIHIVRRDETVWDIAKQYCPKGEDVRRFMFEIAQDNELKDYIICPGDVLNIRK